jgi:hypothetical protein
MRKLALIAALTACCAVVSANAQVIPPGTNPVPAGAAYNATPPTIPDGQAAWLQVDSAGNLRTVASGSASLPTGASTSANQANGTQLTGINAGPTGTLTNRSGTVATGGTAQTLAAINATRKYLFVENSCAATESLWINFMTAAVVTQPSIEIPACGSFLMSSPNFVSTELVSVIATTSAHAFIAKEN